MIDKKLSTAPLRLAVLISGGGSTLRNLLDRIAAGQLDAQVTLVVSSHGKAGGLGHAETFGIPAAIVQRSLFADDAQFSGALFDAVRQHGADLVVMAGFIKKVVVPDDFVGRVINVHPALIPNFCGHGYYGRHVHEAVLAAGAAESGCTVHWVDDHYDHGPIIAQARVTVLADDTPDTLAARVQAAERELYPTVIARFASGELSLPAAAT